jgi:hypothetical protein
LRRFLKLFRDVSLQNRDSKRSGQHDRRGISAVSHRAGFARLAATMSGRACLSDTRNLFILRLAAMMSGRACPSEQFPPKSLGGYASQ